MPIKAREIVSGPTINDREMEREKKHLGGYAQGGSFKRPLPKRNIRKRPPS